MRCLRVCICSLLRCPPSSVLPADLSVLRSSRRRRRELRQEEQVLDDLRHAVVERHGRNLVGPGNERLHFAARRAGRGQLYHVRPLLLLGPRLDSVEHLFRKLFDLLLDDILLLCALRRPATEDVGPSIRADDVQGKLVRLRLEERRLDLIVAIGVDTKVLDLLQRDGALRGPRIGAALRSERRTEGNGDERVRLPTSRR